MKRMQWSKLKSRVKERICPELKDTIDFYVTTYRHAHDDVERVWVTVNGEMIYSVKYYAYHRAAAEAFFCGLGGNAIRSVLREIEIFQPKDFGDALRSYLDLPIRDALASSNPLIKAFAIIDRRAGKRSLAKLEVADSEHPLVRIFYSLRVD